MPGMLSGLSVVTPAAWWALLALGIPLLIHLFSRSRGRLVRIGHIDLIRQARRLQVTEVKLTRWLLLLLRFGIFTLAALILGGLATAGLNSSDAPTIYLTSNWLKTSDSEAINTVLSDAEQTQGSRVFLLQPGFPQADLELLKTSGQQPLADVEDSGKIWSLLSERLSLVHHNGKVTVYATDHILQFGSHKPALPHDVDWRISHPQHAPVVDHGSIRAVIVFEPDRAADAALLSAVLSTLKEHRLPGLLWESVAANRSVELPGNTDWLIRLGNEVLDPAKIAEIKRPTVILTDTGDGVSESASQFVSFPFYPFTTFRLERFARHKVDEDERVLLSTEDDSPLLHESHFGYARIVRFNSRFNPQWNSLALQPEFPELLLQLMSDPGRESQRFPDARIDPANLQTRHAISKGDIPLPRRSLQWLLTILLVFLWITERWLSERKPREKY
ncbi:MAG: BatA domain-containing protein [Lysobacterales bacterium]